MRVEGCKEGIIQDSIIVGDECMILLEGVVLRVINPCQHASMVVSHVVQVEGDTSHHTKGCACSFEGPEELFIVVVIHGHLHVYRA